MGSTDSFKQRGGGNLIGMVGMEALEDGFDGCRMIKVGKTEGNLTN